MQHSDENFARSPNFLWEGFEVERSSFVAVAKKTRFEHRADSLFSQQVVLTEVIVSSRSSPDLKTFWDGGEDTYSTRRPFLKKNYKTNFFGYLSG